MRLERRIENLGGKEVIGVSVEEIQTLQAVIVEQEEEEDNEE